jgi:hypothetical protein
MDNFDHKKWDKQRVNAPEGMYEQVRQRILHERMRVAKTHRQLAIGSSLLLLIGVFNVGIVLFWNTSKKPDSKVNFEQILYKTYFDNALNFSDEK